MTDTRILTLAAVGVFLLLVVGIAWLVERIVRRVVTDVLREALPVLGATVAELATPRIATALASAFLELMPKPDAKIAGPAVVADVVQDLEESRAAAATLAGAPKRFEGFRVLEPSPHHAPAGSKTRFTIEASGERPFHTDHETAAVQHWESLHGKHGTHRFWDRRQHVPLRAERKPT
ncbi:MAG: hypothetical protein ACRDMZ_17740 [Solirubrobacteraceae bacterium]